MWDERSDAFTLQFYCYQLVIVIAALAVNVADEEFDLWLTDTIAHVEVDENENFLERGLDYTIREIGRTAPED